MKYKIPIFVALSVAGVFIGSTQLGKDKGPKVRAPKSYRLALLNKQCSSVPSGCDHKYTIENSLCMCTTEQVEDLDDEVKNVSTLPINRHHKFLVCEHTEDSTVLSGWYPIGETPNPVDWRCETILALGVKEKSVETKGRLVEALEQRCCSACSGECFITNGKTWGACPQCRLDNSCKDYCP